MLTRNELLKTIINNTNSKDEHKENHPEPNLSTKLDYALLYFEIEYLRHEMQTNLRHLEQKIEGAATQAKTRNNQNLDKEMAISFECCCEKISKKVKLES